MKSEEDGERVVRLYRFIGEFAARAHGEDGVIAVGDFVDFVLGADVHVAREDVPISISMHDTTLPAANEEALTHPCISPNGPSGPVSVIERVPSSTISEFAGT